MLHRHHDMGGLDAGSIEQHEHDYAPWEKQVDAIMRLLVAKGHLNVDQLRRGIEEIGPGAYDQMSYYERWITSVTNHLLEQSILEPSELGDAIEAARQSHARAAAVKGHEA